MGGSRSNNESNCPFSSSCSSDDKLSVTVGGCEGVLCVCVSGRGGRRRGGDEQCRRCTRCTYSYEKNACCTCRLR